MVKKIQLQILPALQLFIKNSAYPCERIITALHSVFLHQAENDTRKFNIFTDTGLNFLRSFLNVPVLNLAEL